jgi:NAD(P)-dependent dehydrogenase (short-subunit alcohol dehydrogenase family)
MTGTTTSLKGRTAMITGAGSGIGRAISLSLAARGANVLVTVRRAETGAQTVRLVEAEGGVAKSLEADCANVDAMAQAVAYAQENFGGLDIMIHNAVYGHGSDRDAIETFTDDKLNKMISVSLTGAYNCAHAAFPLLKASKGGRFIGMASTFGLHGVSIDPGYAAIKSGTRAFTKALAREWGPYGITVNCFAPSALSEAAEEWFGANPEIKREYYKKFPMGRIGHPRIDVAEAIAETCGPAFDYMSGQTILLDGGMYTAL